MPSRLSPPEQLPFAFRRHGGARAGAGRKARAERVGLLPHLARGEHSSHHPVHVTARAVPGVPSLRSERTHAALVRVFARASEKGFALLHFAVQGNHLHLIVEADDATTLSRGIQRLLSRAAMAINALLGRAGPLWRDRHHRKTLTCPSQVRSALIYVLFNDRKHQQESGHFGRGAYEGMDPFTSWIWLDGWADTARPSEEALQRAGPRIVAQPSTWLARTGWRGGGGYLRGDEIPRWG